MLIADQIRGPHSTGVMAARRHGKLVDIAKSIGPTNYLLDQKSYDKAMTSQLNCLIGHNRSATVGDISWGNAHPFEFRGIVGAHNGTLDWSSRRRLHNYEKYGTDSEAVFATIQEKGLQETYEEIEGAWALVWYDKDAKIINFLRNDKRDLFYAFTKDRKALIWASEAMLLRWIATRNGVELDENKILIFNEDVHYRWTIPEKTDGAFEEPTRAKMERKRVRENFQHWERAYGHGAYGSSQYHHTGTQHRSGHQNVLAFPSARAQTPSAINTSKWRPPYKRPTGSIVNKRDFTEYMKDGCVFCNDTKIQWGEYVHFLRADVDGKQNLFLCEECYKDDDVRGVCKDLLQY